jgi:valyl-tRNA synthetase
LNEAVKEVTKGLEGYDYNLASKSIFEFFWNEFCDWYIESIKPVIYQEGFEKIKENTQAVLLTVLDKSLRLLSPFMPFITEEIWQMLPLDHEKKHLMISDWPEIEELERYAGSSDDFRNLMEVIRGIRNVRSELQLPPSKKIEIACTYKTDNKYTHEEEIYLKALASIATLKETGGKPAQSATAFVSPEIDVYCILGDMIDWDEEKARVAKKLKAGEKDCSHFEKKLNNEKFIKNAKEDVIEETKAKYKDALITLERLKKLMEDFEG